MRPLRIRALLSTAAGLAALPIVGPLLSAMRAEWEAAMIRGDLLEQEADASSARADAACSDLADTKALWQASNRLVEAQMAKAKADIDTLRADERTWKRRADERSEGLKVAACNLVRAHMMVDERDATVRGLQSDLAAASGERDAARKERDELALRLAAETERCASVCESMIDSADRSASPALLDAADAIRGFVKVAPAEPDPVRDWPQPGVDEKDACQWCGCSKPERSFFFTCSDCANDPSFDTADLINRIDARSALKSVAAAPKSST